MNYTLMPSLEHGALIRTAITSWNQSDIRALMTEFYFPLLGSERREKWQEIEDKVIEKIPQLPQPEPLKKEILGFVKPIGLQILKWMEYHDENCYLGIDLPNELCWTPQGAVDKKKTAEALIKDENLDITRRYRLACIYCLEDDVRELWNSMPQRKKAAFYNEGHPSFSKEHELVVFWTYDIKGEVAKLNGLIKKIKGKEISPYQFAFEYAAVGGNKAASEYFLQKLTPGEREESLVRYAGYVANRRSDCVSNPTDLPKEDYADVLCFLLSQMNEEQQMEVFERYPYEVLKCLLDWPWQGFFMETANHMWGFLPEEDYNLLLRIIVNKVIDGYKDCNYQKLFEEFWQQSSMTHKAYVIDECASGSLLSKLFKVKDKKNIALILNDATTPEKEKIIFYREGKDICEGLAYGNEWDLLEFFISECISSQEKMIKFKEEFKKRIVRCRSKEKLEEEKDMRCKFFQLLDDLIQKGDKKRSMEEENSSPAKRLCSLTSEQLSSSKEIFKG
ncbi:hypothetical protein [Wolbachia endosymbiont (group A) of Ectemnius continuus]|uniref:hypothetical protein n=1 Tax=Wolbachia endosymbiont (group A) of Ectemnius continuus TaxID=2954002 RepID=UPI0022310FF3|nr:hypothetical protein [Wolbachia endosymbiont (group A) of Ectemnius continuus]